MILYQVNVDDQFHFTYGDLDKATWHIQIALEVGHDCQIISDSDYDHWMPRVGLVQDRDLPWTFRTETGVSITITRTYGLDGNGSLMVGIEQGDGPG